MDNNGKFCMGACFNFFSLLLFCFKIMIIRATKSYLKVHENFSPSISKHRKGVVKNIGAMLPSPLCISQIFSYTSNILWQCLMAISRACVDGQQVSLPI